MIPSTNLFVPAFRYRLLAKGLKALARGAVCLPGRESGEREGISVSHAGLLSFPFEIESIGKLMEGKEEEEALVGWQTWGLKLSEL